MTKEDDLITTDKPLGKALEKQLRGLLDTLIPATEDGVMLSAADIDLMPYLQLHSAESIPMLIQLLNELDDQFASLTQTARESIVEQLSIIHPGPFKIVTLQVFACYYQDERAQRGIGMDAGPPFPRGNSVEPGDLSLLDPVIAGRHSYRKVED